MMLAGIAHSKHATPPGKGKVDLAWNSGFRKLRRAFRRNKIRPEWEVLIQMAMESAKKTYAPRSA